MNILNLNQTIRTFNGELSVNISLNKSQLCKITGDNGVGKSSFVQFLKSTQLQREEVSFSFCDQMPLQAINQITVGQLINDLKNDFSTKFKPCEELSAFLDEQFFKTPINQLSGGQNQLLKVFISLSFARHIYVLDEPSQYLDKTKLAALRLAISELKQIGGSFIIIDHQQAYLEGLIDQQYIMEKNNLEYRLYGI